MPPAAHPGRLLKRELTARGLSANRLALDIGVPSGRITDILNGRRSITADTAVRLGRYFGNSAQFWLDLQGQYDIAVVERDRGAEIGSRVHQTNTAGGGVGLDNRARDTDGEIRHKRGDTLVGTLRQTYGQDFAKGYRSDTSVSNVLKTEKSKTSPTLGKQARSGRKNAS
jgi:addiction module HigA family antidote